MGRGSSDLIELKSSTQQYIFLKLEGVGPIEICHHLEVHGMLVKPETPHYVPTDTRTEGSYPKRSNWVPGRELEDSVDHLEVSHVP